MRVHFASALLVVALAGCCTSGTIRRPGRSVDQTALCGVEFRLSPDWVAALDVPSTRDKNTRCSFTLRPINWQQIRGRSDWRREDPPLSFSVFNVPFEEAALAMGFTGSGIPGMMGGYGTYAGAVKVHVQRYTGYRVDTFYRTWLKDSVELPSGVNRIYSGEMVHLVLQSRDGRVLGFVWQDDIPGEYLDAEGVVLDILRSLKWH